MHTFTGLLASLDLGDHTNFTAIPAIGTNVATYGPWGWRNFIIAWQERYKVLEALKMTKANLPGTVLARYSEREAWYATNYISLYNKTVATGASSRDTTYLPYLILFYYAAWDGSQWSQGYIYNASFRFSSLSLSTQMQSSVYVYFFAQAPYFTATKRFNDNGYGLIEDAYNLLDAGSLETNTYVLFNPDTAIPVSGSVPTNETTVTGFWGTDLSCYAKWQFNYATNKYW